MAQKPDKIEINARTMHKIRDIAHRIWVETREPNANLIMFEALRQYIVHQGQEPGFTIATLDIKE